MSHAFYMSATRQLQANILQIHIIFIYTFPRQTISLWSNHFWSQTLTVYVRLHHTLSSQLGSLHSLNWTNVLQSYLPQKQASSNNSHWLRYSIFWLHIWLCLLLVAGHSKMDYLMNNTHQPITDELFIGWKEESHASAASQSEIELILGWIRRITCFCS